MHILGKETMEPKEETGLSAGHFDRSSSWYCSGCGCGDSFDDHWNTHMGWTEGSPENDLQQAL